MNTDSTNIYRQCRQRADFTVKEAVAKLNVGKRSLEYWEAEDGRIPNEEIVIEMANKYHAGFLLVQHQTLNTEIGRILFPEFRMMDLAIAMINYHLEQDRLKEKEREIMGIVVSATTSQSEKQMVSRYMEYLSESIVSGLILQAALLKKGFKIEKEQKQENKISWR